MPIREMYAVKIDSKLWLEIVDKICKVYTIVTETRLVMDVRSFPESLAQVDKLLLKKLTLPIDNEFKNLFTTIKTK